MVVLQPLGAGSNLMIPIFGGVPEGMIELPNIPTGEYRRNTMSYLKEGVTQILSRPSSD